MAGGRPSKYKPEYCDALIKHMGGGLSFETFAALCDVCRDTLYDWTAAHKEFLDAKRKGEMQSQFFWEKVGREGALGTIEKFNATTWIYTMKCRFPKQWGDKQEVSHVIADRREAKALTDDELDTLLIQSNPA